MGGWRGGKGIQIKVSSIEFSPSFPAGEEEEKGAKEGRRDSKEGGVRRRGGGE